MSSKKWTWLGVCVLVAVALMVTLIMGACAPTAPEEKGTVKIGFVGPYSGGGAQMGKLMRECYQLAVDEQNAKGGILGGRMVEALYYDDQMDPGQAAIVVRKAIGVDHVKAMVGNFEPATAAATRDLCRDNNIPFVSWADGIKNYMEGYKGMIQCAPDPASEDGFVWNGMETAGLKTVALVCEEMEWGHELATLYHWRWDVAGSPVKIVEEVWHSMAKSDLISEYTKALASNPDAVVLAEFSIPAIQAAINATHQLGYKGVRFGVGPFADEQFVAGLSEAANGIKVAGFMFPPPGIGPSGEAFCALVREKIPNADITDIGAISWDCANIIMLAFDKAGTDSDLNKIGDAFWNLKYRLVMDDDNYKINEYGKVIITQRLVSTIENGKFVGTHFWKYTEDYLKIDQEHAYTPTPGYTVHPFYP